MPWERRHPACNILILLVVGCDRSGGFRRKSDSLVSSMAASEDFSLIAIGVRDRLIIGQNPGIVGSSIAIEVRFGC